MIKWRSHFIIGGWHLMPHSVYRGSKWSSWSEKDRYHIVPAQYGKHNGKNIHQEIPPRPFPFFLSRSFAGSRSLPLSLFFSLSLPLTGTSVKVIRKLLSRDSGRKLSPKSSRTTTSTMIRPIFDPRGRKSQLESTLALPSCVLQLARSSFLWAG